MSHFLARRKLLLTSYRFLSVSLFKTHKKVFFIKCLFFATKDCKHYIYMSIYIYLYISIYIYLYISIYIYLSIYLSIYMYTYIYTYLYNIHRYFLLHWIAFLRGSKCKSSFKCSFIDLRQFFNFIMCP